MNSTAQPSLSARQAMKTARDRAISTGSAATEKSRSLTVHLGAPSRVASHRTPPPAAHQVCPHWPPRLLLPCVPAWLTKRRAVARCHGRAPTLALAVLALLCCRQPMRPSAASPGPLDARPSSSAASCWWSSERDLAESRVSRPNGDGRERGEKLRQRREAGKGRCDPFVRGFRTTGSSNPASE